MENIDEDTLKKLEEFWKINKDTLKDIYSRQYSDFDSIEKKIDCPHEIVFTIKASVLEENDKGETTGCKEVCHKNYHIPVPPDKDYNVYMNTFFEFLENCISESAKKTNEDLGVSTNE